MFLFSLEDIYSDFAMSLRTKTSTMIMVIMTTIATPLMDI